MKEEIYKCDGCGKQKGETNHWYCLVKIDGPSRYYEIRITQFDLAPTADRIHLCGEQCLLKMVARHLPK